MSEELSVCDLEDDSPNVVAPQKPLMIEHTVIESRVNRFQASTLIDEDFNSSFMSTRFAHQHRQ